MIENKPAGSEAEPDITLLAQEQKKCRQPQQLVIILLALPHKKQGEV